MVTTQECIKHAEVCHKKATETHNEKDRQTWLEMEKIWLRLAQSHELGATIRVPQSMTCPDGET